MIALVAASVVVVLGAVALFASRDRFARGLAILLVLMAGTLLSVAIPLLRRDPGLRARLADRIAAGDGPAALAEEGARIDEVIRKYPIYRWGYLAMLLAAGVIAFVTRGALANGVAVGLVLFAAAGLVVDHYSEARAGLYRARLSAAL